MRSSVVALRIRDGSQIWKTYMTDPPKQTGVSSEGTPTYGPSGAGIWSAPTLDRERGLLYAATGDNYSQPANKLSDAVVALDLCSGKIVEWGMATDGQNVYAAVTAIPGAVFSGSVDGHLRAFSSEDGKVLWDFDTAREFRTVDGIKGQGGSVDGPGAVIVKGMVFVNSGYLRQAEMQGNVLLAFTAE